MKLRAGWRKRWRVISAWEVGWYSWMRFQRVRVGRFWGGCWSSRLWRSRKREGKRNCRSRNMRVQDRKYSRKVIHILKVTTSWSEVMSLQKTRLLFSLYSQYQVLLAVNLHKVLAVSVTYAMHATSQDTYSSLQASTSTSTTNILKGKARLLTQNNSIRL